MSVIRTLASTENPLFSQASMSAAAAASSRRASLNQLLTAVENGERWAARLMPAQLKELMRHESIETTLRFYVGTDAQRTADAAWAAFEASRPKNLEAAGNSLANSAPSDPPPPPIKNRRKPNRRQALPSNGAAGTRTQDQRIKSPML